MLLHPIPFSTLSRRRVSEDPAATGAQYPTVPPRPQHLWDRERLIVGRASFGGLVPESGCQAGYESLRETSASGFGLRQLAPMAWISCPSFSSTLLANATNCVP